MVPNSLILKSIRSKLWDMLILLKTFQERKVRREKTGKREKGEVGGSRGGGRMFRSESM